MSASILFITPYPKDVAPSQRLKFEQYYAAFGHAGFLMKQSAFMSDQFWRIVYRRGFILQKFAFTWVGYMRRLRDLLRLRRFDMIYVHLWVTPFGPPVFEWLYCLLARKVVFDIDDMTFLGHSSRANRFIQWLKGTSKPIYLMKHSDHVITCTPKLDAFVRRYNQHTTDISSTIDTEAYVPRNDYSIKGVITLGWSGSHSTSRYLHLLDGVLQQLVRESIRFKLLVIGDDTFGMPGVPTEAIAWNLDTEVRDLSRIDIGLYPLPDEEWVHGKSGLKALQYMGLGIPTVATGIGANFRIIQDGVNGFLVRPLDDAGWITHIKSLANNQSLRETIGRAGRDQVVRNFSVKSTTATYLEVFSRVLSKTPSIS
jgi:glycosyltransferase involved in cell wall biosynthesis